MCFIHFSNITLTPIITKIKNHAGRFQAHRLRTEGVFWYNNKRRKLQKFVLHTYISIQEKFICGRGDQNNRTRGPVHAFIHVLVLAGSGSDSYSNPPIWWVGYGSGLVEPYPAGMGTVPYLKLHLATSTGHTL